VVAAGTPEEVAAVGESYTGVFLRKALGLDPVTGRESRQLETRDSRLATRDF
jgi:hypothetical protein